MIPPHTHTHKHIYIYLTYIYNSWNLYIQTHIHILTKQESLKLLEENVEKEFAVVALSDDFLDKAL